MQQSPPNGESKPAEQTAGNKDAGSEATDQVKPPYEPPRLQKFERLEKLIVSGE